MDSGMSNPPGADLSKLSEKEKRELQQLIENEGRKAHIQMTVHNLTDTCWKKCMTGAIRNGKLDKNEESCTQNCVDRFLDANFTVIKHLETMRDTRM